MIRFITFICNSIKLPWDAKLNAAPNARALIERPTDHARSMHKKKAIEKKKKQTTLAPSSTSSSTLELTKPPSTGNLFVF